MKLLNFDYTLFTKLRSLLKNNVYWLDKHNNYKVYKFEISKISIEPIEDRLFITLELYPIDTVKLFQYHSCVDINYDNMENEVFYSYDSARKMQAKKLLERQGSLF